jgi:hypothetical protein
MWYLYLLSCESSSRCRAAASSVAMEDLPAPEGPHRRISGPVVPPVSADTIASEARGRESVLTKQGTLPH